MKAMILAAGLGKRMRPLTDNTPKPLLIVQGRPLLAHHIERLRAAGCDEIVVNVSYLAEQIEAFLSAEKYSGLTLNISRETEPLETAGGIVEALSLLGDEPFLLLNSDVWIDYPLDRLVAIAQTQISSKSGSSLAHLVMVGNPEHNSGGDFKLPAKKGSGVSMLNSEVGEALTYSGVAVYHPSLFENIEPGKRPLGPLLTTWIKEGKVSGEKFSGYWLDVGTPARLQQLDDYLNL